LFLRRGLVINTDHRDGSIIDPMRDDPELPTHANTAEQIAKTDRLSFAFRENFLHRERLLCRRLLTA
jgi:hypothetical protein